MLGDRYWADGRFPTTHWTLIARAGVDDVAAGREALGDLLVRYLPALHAHLVYGRRISPEEAEDVVQEFVAGKILEHHLIGRADRQLGKFRTFLLAALDRFLIDRIRRADAKKRSPEGALLNVGDREELLRAEREPSDAFDTAWARGVLSRAMDEMRAECEASGRAEIWGIFECRVLKPILGGAEPADYAQLVERFGFQSPTQAANALVTAKRMFARALRSAVGEYARDESEIDSEIHDLQAILARAGR